MDLSQACSTSNEPMRQAIRLADTVSEARDLARGAEKAAGWDRAMEIMTMEKLCRDKVRRHKAVLNLLKSSESLNIKNDYKAEKGDKRGDPFFGMVNGVGQNHLGRILMNIRSDIGEGKEFEEWVASRFLFHKDLEDNPVTTIESWKSGKCDKSEVLSGSHFFILGRVEDCHYKLEHPSVSRLHAMLAFDKKHGLTLTCLGAAQGSFVKGEKCRPYMPIKLKPGLPLTFGASNRQHKIKLDRSNLIARLQEKAALLEAELARSIDMTEEEMMAELEREAKPSSTVFIGNLSFDTGEGAIRELFTDAGEILELRLPRHKDTGVSKGICFIKYSKPDEAQKAVRSYNGDELDDRLIKVSIAQDDDHPDRDRPARPGKGGKGKGGKGKGSDGAPVFGLQTMGGQRDATGIDRGARPSWMEKGGSGRGGGGGGGRDRDRSRDRDSRRRSRSRDRDDSRRDDRRKDDRRDERRDVRRGERREERRRDRSPDNDKRRNGGSQDDFGRDVKSSGDEA